MRFRLDAAQRSIALDVLMRRNSMRLRVVDVGAGQRLVSS